MMYNIRRVVKLVRKLQLIVSGRNQSAGKCTEKILKTQFFSRKYGQY